MKNRHILLFAILSFLLLILFLADLAFGSIRIPIESIPEILFNRNGGNMESEILLNFRLPKALTAIIAGASLSVAGLMMQTLFRNPLADPYILGVSSGASLGVALITMASAILPAMLFILSILF